MLDNAGFCFPLVFTLASNEGPQIRFSLDSESIGCLKQTPAIEMKMVVNFFFFFNVVETVDWCSAFISTWVLLVYLSSLQRKTPENYITQTSLQLGFCRQDCLCQLDSLGEDFGGRSEAEAFDCCFWQG